MSLSPILWYLQLYGFHQPNHLASRLRSVTHRCSTMNLHPCSVHLFAIWVKTLRCQHIEFWSPKYWSFKTSNLAALLSPSLGQQTELSGYGYLTHKPLEMSSFSSSSRHACKLLSEKLGEEGIFEAFFRIFEAFFRWLSITSIFCPDPNTKTKKINRGEIFAKKIDEWVNIATHSNHQKGSGTGLGSGV
jgi:hypothetical protein